jgi:hypothetical protein
VEEEEIENRRTKEGRGSEEQENEGRWRKGKAGEQRNEEKRQSTRTRE